MNFCTLFDSNFLLQGLTMYRSLENTCDNFHLYILALDDLSAEMLRKMKLSHATIITTNQFENEELKKARTNRTKREYYWTCSSSLILYTIEHFGLDVCTYLDADMLFFDTPKILLDELGYNSVLVVDHRYDPDHDKGYKHGKYCVQFNTFKNNEDGLKVLRWWRDRCIEWCYATPKDGKFGDQKYLDDWPERFQGVWELENLGGGVAPWNVSRYKFFERDKKVFGRVTKTKEEFQLVFYHFHKTNLYNIFGKLKIKSYQAINKNKNLQYYIYRPYIKALELSMTQIKAIDDRFALRFGSTIKFILETLKEVF